MAMDPDIVNQLNTSHSRGIAAAAGFAENNNQVMTQLGSLIASGNANDNRLLNGYLAGQLFNQNVMESKSAFYNPVGPGAAPLAPAQTAK